MSRNQIIGLFTNGIMNMLTASADEFLDTTKRLSQNSFPDEVERIKVLLGCYALTARLETPREAVLRLLYVEVRRQSIEESR